MPSLPAPCILVVDDEPGAREMLREFLTYHEFDVELASNGREALEILRSRKVDLVLSDVHMPVMTGTELLNRIREEMPGLPVILVTGQPSIDTAVNSLRKGVVDYVTKPFDLGLLRSRIHDALPSTVTVERTLAMEEPARVVGGYAIRKRINEGAMGIIYLAERNGQRYALKLIRSIFTSEERCREQVERFIREAEVAARLRHPNIVEIVDYGIAEDEPAPFMVMEYVEGIPLDAYATQLPADAYRAKAEILRQVADALAAIHGLGICHRDIKPGNVLVDKNNCGKLTDFGIARIPGSELTMHDEILGSPLYMAPESYLTSQVDQRADIFSFGVMAYEFLLGELPFQGDSVTEIAHHICREKPVQPRRLQKEFPVRLETILARTLKKSPDDRYRTAAELAGDLAHYLGTSPTWQDRIEALTRGVAVSEDWA